MKNNVLVFLQKRPFLGAQVVHIPFLHYVREKYSGCKIIGICPSPNSEKYLYELGYLDEVHPYDHSRNNLFRYASVLRRLRGFEASVAFQLRRSSFKGMVLACFCGAERKVGFKGLLSRYYLNSEVPYDRSRYGAEVYLDLLDEDGIRLAEFAASAERRKNDYVLLIPAGTSTYKLYPTDQYVEMARILRQQHEVHFLPGKGMKEVLDGLASVQDTCVVHRDKSTREIRDIILGARLVIANDCGPSHFAHIYDVPRIGLFADYAYRPGGKDVTKEYFRKTERSHLIVSQNGKIASIRPEHIAEKALELISRAKA